MKKSTVYFVAAVICFGTGAFAAGFISKTGAAPLFMLALFILGLKFGKKGQLFYNIEHDKPAEYVMALNQRKMALTYLGISLMLGIFFTIFVIWDLTK